MILFINLVLKEVKMKKVFFSLATFLVLATTYNFNEINPKIQYIEITEDDIAQFIVEEGNN